MSTIDSEREAALAKLHASATLSRLSRNAGVGRRVRAKCHERWALDSAVATVHRTEKAVRVRLKGLVTALAIEAAHLRLHAERAERRELVIDGDALMAVTCRSAAEAGLRGTPAVGGRPLYIGVPLKRLNWALEFCLLLNHEGLLRVPFVLEGAAA